MDAAASAAAGRRTVDARLRGADSGGGATARYGQFAAVHTPGLANVDEQQVAALGFERLILVRSAREPARLSAGNVLHRVARAMLSALSYMVPQGDRPVRAMHVARLVETALLQAPPGIHVAAPERVWRAAQKMACRPSCKTG